MINIPKRSDTIYKEIEEFEDYELTQCVAYEMAIRNEYNLKLLDEIVGIYTNNKEEDMYANINFEDKHQNKQLRILYKINSSEIIPFASNLEYFGGSGLDYQDSIFNDNLIFFEDNRIHKIIYDIINDITIAEDGNKKRGLLSENTRVICDDILNENILEKRIFREGYFIRTSMSESQDYAFAQNLEDEYELSSVEDWKNYLEDGAVELKSTNEIISNFKRPKLKIHNTLLNKFPTLKVDLSKPLKEIIAYISHVKKDIEINNIIKAPIELIGEKLQKADNLMCNDKGKCFDSRTILSKQQKIADMFYIYDCKKVKMTQRKIQNEVYNYYADTDINTSQTLDAKTLKKYLDISIEYIDKRRYRELSTGIEAPDIFN
ncbi:MAG: hypothetical protein QM497_01675 [Sulfurimonas sp.]